MVSAPADNLSVALRELLVNGDASQGLNGWQIISSSGSGWSTENGPGESCPQIPGNSNFVTSIGWSRKSQLIDLVAAGFTADYLDHAPRLYISDWVCGRSDAASTYQLRVELRDANQKVIKSFVTPKLDTPRAPNWVYPWRRIFREFHRYGAGLRYIYFEHGGTDVPSWAGWYGAKMTGASVQMATELSRHRNLLQNPDGASGMSGWTVIASSGNGWTVENVAASCPSSAGQTNFVTSYGWSKRSQTVDLVASGYTPAQLDAAPEIRVEEWVCGRSDAASRYYMTAKLLDANHNVIAQYATGEADTPRLPDFAYPFTRVSATFVDYGPGVRFVTFEDGGSDVPGWRGSYGAKMTGAYVGVVEPPPHPLLPKLGEQLPAVPDVNDNRVRVAPTDVVPSKWVCDLHGWFGNAGYGGSGWLIPTDGPYAVVVTAAHCVFHKRLGFATRIEVFPARDAATEPFQSFAATGNQIQVAQRYLVDANGGVVRQPLYDYGAIVVPKAGLDWGNDGLSPIVASDDEIRAATIAVTGYPGDKPDDTMWTASGGVTALNPSSFSYSTIYTAPGQSGCPAFESGTQRAIGIHVKGLPARTDDLMSPYGGMATRITDEVSGMIASWATPLTPDTRVTKLELIIQTGNDEGAGTNDTINFTLKGQNFGNPDDTWFKDRSERDQIDGYDLTDKMNALFPDGLYVRDLTGAHYTIKRVFEWLSGWGYWFWGNWEVDTIVIMVNGHRFHTNRCRQWLTEFVGQLPGTITETS